MKFGFFYFVLFCVLLGVSNVSQVVWLLVGSDVIFSVFCFIVDRVNCVYMLVVIIINISSEEMIGLFRLFIIDSLIVVNGVDGYIGDGVLYFFVEVGEFVVGVSIRVVVFFDLVCRQLFFILVL